MKQVIRNFAWQGHEEKKKKHQMAWEKVIKAKELEGLSLINLKQRKQAYLV